MYRVASTYDYAHTSYFNGIAGRAGVSREELKSVAGIVMVSFLFRQSSSSIFCVSQATRPFHLSLDIPPPRNILTWKYLRVHSPTLELISIGSGSRSGGFTGQHGLKVQMIQINLHPMKYSCPYHTVFHGNCHLLIVSWHWCVFKHEPPVSAGTPLFDLVNLSLFEVSCQHTSGRVYPHSQLNPFTNLSLCSVTPWTNTISSHVILPIKMLVKHVSALKQGLTHSIWSHSDSDTMLCWNGSTFICAE